MIAIDSSKVKGEPGTGYEPPAGKGPFNCGNCGYFNASDSSCGQKTMMERSKQPRTGAGRVQVDPEGCCEYVERKGSAQKDAFKAATDARQGSMRAHENDRSSAPGTGAGSTSPAPLS